MKKILFRKILFDCLVFFSIALISVSTIIWIFQAVNYLDVMVEDGRDYLVYINFALLNYPKIISKLLPFTLFFSFYYVFTKYELNNELMIYWNFGVNKIYLINFFIKFSFFLVLIQLLLTIFIVPETLNFSKTLIKKSNVDFFGSFIKPQKFNDNISGLTIYAEEKNKNNELKNIYLKQKKNEKEFQITIAKKGYFKNIGNSKILVLNDGETINSINNNVTNFSFSKSDFILSTLKTNMVIDDKIQEEKTINHIKCFKKYLNKNLTINLKQKGYLKHNCSLDTLDSLVQELYKRLIVPLYIPLLILLSSLLVLFSKENKYYLRYKVIIFISGLMIIILSESLLRFVKGDFYSNILIMLMPLIIYSSIYIFIKQTLKINLKQTL
jgi:lipopolysaccharide export system permease protein